MASQVHETPETYAAVTLPYIGSIPPSRIQWVYNVLDCKVPSVLCTLLLSGVCYAPVFC